MDVALVGTLAMAGLGVGTLAATLIARLADGSRPFLPLSRCPRCRRSGPIELAPLVGWWARRGHCGRCGESYGRWQPLVEAATAAVFALLGVKLGPDPALPAFLCLSAVSVVLAGVDLAVQRLPNVVTLPAYPLGLGLLAAAASVSADGPRRLLGAALGMAALWLFYAALAFINPRGMGWGDVKYAGVLGIPLGWLGWHALVAATLAAFLLGGLYGLGLVLARRATRRSQFPFGPFMAAGALLAVLVAGS